MSVYSLRLIIPLYGLVTPESYSLCSGLLCCHHQQQSSTVQSALQTSKDYTMHTNTTTEIIPRRDYDKAAFLNEDDDVPFTSSPFFSHAEAEALARRV